MSRVGASILVFIALLLICISYGAVRPMSLLAVGNGRIVFASERTGNWELFTMNADGSNVINLTNSPADDERPSYSTDGQKIAFTRTIGGNADIYTINANGSGLQRLTTDPEDDNGAQWSPDGTKIVFRSIRNDNTDIYVMNADGTGQTRLTTNSSSETGPDWSPDGQKIAFASTRTGNGDIFIMNSDGSGQIQLTTNPANDIAPAWSPDGNRIAFRSDRSGAADVYVMQSNGQGTVNLSNHPAEDRDPAWSPDGSKIVFHSDRNGDYEIYVMDADGSDVVRLTYSPGRDLEPDWGGNEDSPPPCYILSTNHSGQGSDPVASPNRSTGCNTGQYIAGENITLTATPAAEWHVAGWSGTNNDASTTPTNTVTMPPANHAVSVIYDQNPPPPCYSLTRSHTGQGSDPLATPAKSVACGTGQYVAGEVISLTGTPAAGWRVAGWDGTSNDGSMSTSNSLVMPSSDRAIHVTYTLVPPDEGRTVLPMILNVGFSEFSPFEVEPNNTDATANGPILFGRNYQGYPNDKEDFFFFDVATGQPMTLNISLDNITGADPQLLLYFNGYPNRVDFDPVPPYRIHYVAPPGRYYVRVIVVSGYNTHTSYVLRVEVEGTE